MQEIVSQSRCTQSIVLKRVRQLPFARQPFQRIDPMTASDFAGRTTGAVVLMVAIGVGSVDNPLTRKALVLLGLATVIWYVWKGHDLKGWIGESYAEMCAEIQRLEALSANWKYPDGSPIPGEKVREIQRRRQRLIESIQFHPDRPR
jgi:hypothetical protein